MYKVIGLQKKSADWLVVSIINAEGDRIDNVSVNRISKKGDLFPGFDEIAEGQKVAGRLWESDSNKMYLFAPKGGAKAPMKQAAINSATNSSYNASEEAEYPMHEKLETILNKLVGQQIKLEQILEIITPKKKAVNDFADDEETDAGVPF